MNVFKRIDGRYEGRIPRGKKQNGKRKFQYILARTKEEVVSRINDIRRNEECHDRCSKTTTIVFNEWFKSIQHHVKESTQANYKMKADKHILPYFGKKYIDSIDQDDIYAFIADRRKKGLSDRYITDIIILMKVIFRFAVRTYNIFNPMVGLALPKRKMLIFNSWIRQNKENFKAILPKIRTLVHLERHFLILQVFVLGSFVHYNGKILISKNVF